MRSIKIWFAKHRLPFMRRQRCRQGNHNPPHNKVFSCMGAVFIGGPCTQCNDEVARELSFLGNAWDFPGVNTSSTPNNFHISVPRLVAAMRERGFTYIGDYPA